MADRVGQQLGNHRLLRLLGRGGFAEVYLGEHLRLGTLVAVKVLYTRLANPSEVENFEKEARTIAHLNHPHIVRVFDFDVQDDTPFLVMDYAPGGTLRQRHSKGTALPLPLIVHYVKQVAAALQYAHDERLIHRDIKPENMLIGQRNAVLLSDFGIATVAQSSHYQATQDMAGTIAYMAPEQIQAHPRPASDQYSLGIVVYEWLSGDRPFHGLFTEIAIKHSMVPPPSLCEKIPTISPEVEQIVMTALAKNPKERFGSVGAFANALEQAWQSEQARDSAAQALGTHSIPPTLLTIKVPPSDLTSPLPVSTFTPPPSFAPLEQASTDKTTEPPGSMTSTPESQPGLGLPASVTSPTPPASSPLSPMEVRSSPLSPNVPSVSTQPRVPSRRGISRRIVVVGLGGLVAVGVTSGGLIWLARSQQAAGPLVFTSPTASRTSIPTTTLSPTSHAATTTLYTFRGHASTVNAVAWSPDGKRIASGGFDHTVQVWNAIDGGNVYIYRGHSHGMHAVAWSPNGQHIASGSEDYTVQVWDASNGGNVFTYKGHANFVNALAWSPNSRRIASASGDPFNANPDHTVQVWDATNGGSALTYRVHSTSVHAVAWSPNGALIASASGDGTADDTVHVWDATNGSDVYTYGGHSLAVDAVAWSPDGKRIASASTDGTVQVWDATNGGNVFTYQGHGFGNVNAVVWSPDGKRIASAADNVQVWDATDGGNVFTYRGHTHIVNALAWSLDGKRIASASDDHTVQIWLAR